MLQPIFAIKFMLSCSALQGQNERKSVADEEHLKIIRQGVDVWNECRKKNPELIPDLSGANLAEANLAEANLTKADLTHANLSGTNLSGAHLTFANLSEAHLEEANLTRANLRAANLSTWS
jgi:uncharacterized protein YjbI with pentapeptide repeats